MRSNGGPNGSDARRFDAVDYVKTAAIIAVVFTHSVLSSQRGMHSPWDDLLGREWVSFHVPAFLAVSGFLYYSESGIPWQRVLERLARVLLPYLVASFVALALGAVPDKAPGFWMRLATGNTQGHFYYVVLIVAYIPLIWLMSRLPSRWLWLAFVLLVLYPLLAHHFKSLRFAETSLVRMRNPIYTAVYFVGGWMLHAVLPELRRLERRMGEPRFWSISFILAVAALGFYFLGPWPGRSWQAGLADRMVYTTGVIVLLCTLARWLPALFPDRRHPPRWVRFSSQATYTIFLYHFLFIYPMRELTLQWPPVVRILTVAGGAFAGASILALVGARLLGTRSKWVLG